MATTKTTFVAPPTEAGRSGIWHRVVRQVATSGHRLKTGRATQDYDKAMELAKETKRYSINEHVWIITENIEVLDVRQV